MEPYRVKLTDRALRDLDRIYAYIAQNLQEPELAWKLVDRIEAGILSLETMPYRCPERKVGAYAFRGYRQLLIQNYVVIFRVDEIQKQVIVVTVRYAPSQF